MSSNPRAQLRRGLGPSSLFQIVDVYKGALLAGVQIRRLEAARGPIVVGPWSSELGFELLYWIPFLRSLIERGLLVREQTVAISRGGVGQWYADVAARYVDLYDLFPDGGAIRQAASPDEGAAHKQMSATGFDREALRLATERLGLPRNTPVLHPSTMYRRFRPAWVERAAPGRVLRQLAFRSLPPPEAEPPVALPERYVAVKAYASGVLPDEGRGKAAFEQLVDGLAKHLPVVLLRLGTQLDNHVELELPENSAVIDLAGTIPVERNLAIQAAVIARSQLLLSTYGGASYLAVLLGVPAVGVYDRDRFGLVHHRVARAMMDTLRPSTRAELTAVSVTQLEYLAFLLSEQRALA
jgi:hypothetical protein